MIIPWEMRLAGGGGVDNCHYEMASLKCYSNIKISVIKHFDIRPCGEGAIDRLADLKPLMDILIPYMSK